MNVLSARTLDFASHVKRHFLGVNEVLEDGKIIDAHSHLPLVEAADLLHADHSNAKAQVQSLSFVQTGYNGMTTCFPQSTPQTTSTHSLIPSDQATTTPAKANLTKQQIGKDNFSSPTPSFMAPSRLRRSASDGDLQATIMAHEFAKLDRTTIKAQLLKPFTSRLLNFRITKAPSPSKEEKFRSQVNKFGLPKAVQLKQERDGQDRRDKKGGNNRSRGSEKSTGARIAAITRMIEGNLHINENGKAPSSFLLANSPPNTVDDDCALADADEMEDCEIGRTTEGILYRGCDVPFDQLGAFASEGNKRT